MSSISTASDSGWPTPIVGSFGPMTFSTGVSSMEASRNAASISASSSTAPDTSAAANGGSFLHTGSCDTPWACIWSMASRARVVGVDVDEGRDLVAAGVEHGADAQVALAEEAEAGQPVVVEDPRQVAAAGVGDEHDDEVVGAELLAQLHGGGHGQAARAADEDALLARRPGGP